MTIRRSQPGFIPKKVLEVLVTHDLEQARRVTDWMACLFVRDGAGELTEAVCCDAMLEDSECFYEFST